METDDTEAAGGSEARDRWIRKVKRRRTETAAAEVLLRAGHPDTAGLAWHCRNWSAELRILEGAETRTPPQG